MVNAFVHVLAYIANPIIIQMFEPYSLATTTAKNYSAFAGVLSPHVLAMLVS